MSRYGINVTEEEVEQTIMESFGECQRRRKRRKENIDEERVAHFDGTEEVIAATVDGSANTTNNDEDSASRKDCMDLSQVLALLLVPLLLKGQRSLIQRQKNTVEIDVGGVDSTSNTQNAGRGKCEALHESTPSLSRDSSKEESCSPNKTMQTISQKHAESDAPAISPNLEQIEPSFAPSWATRHCDKGDRNWPDADLFENVLQMILHDATGDPKPQPLTKDLLRQILNFYGEGEMAIDDEFLEEMITAASPAPIPATDQTSKSSDSINTSSVVEEKIGATDVEGESILLDKYAFARALTHDLHRYSIDKENDLTTNYYDVFGTLYSTKEGDKKKRHLTENMMTVQVIGEEEDVRPVQRIFTFPSIGEMIRN